MRYEYREITVRDLTRNALSMEENGNYIPYDEAGGNPTEFGVKAMGGCLNVRPSYQREFVWSEKKQRKFIDSIEKGFVINNLVMATSDIDKLREYRDNGTPLDESLNLECVDGQQRITTLLNFTYNLLKDNEATNFGGYSTAIQEKFLNHNLMIQFVQYDDLDEKRNHFQSINEANVILTQQELRNAAFSGKFVDSLKVYFSHAGKYADEGFNYHGCSADDIKSQKFTETAILWYLTIHDDAIYDKATNTAGHELVSNESGDDVDMAICNFMKKHINKDAKFVYDEYKKVFAWICKTFGNNGNKIMTKVKNWAYLYRTYKDFVYDSNVLKETINELNKDSEIHYKYNVPEYALFSNRPNISMADKKTWADNNLNITNFDSITIEEVFKDVQNCDCVNCGQFMDIKNVKGARITPWVLGGRADKNNCLVLCPTCYNKFNSEWMIKLADM